MIAMEKVLGVLAEHEAMGCCGPKALEHVSQSIRRLDLAPKPAGNKHGCQFVWVNQDNDDPYFAMHTVHGETCPWRDR